MSKYGTIDDGWGMSCDLCKEDCGLHIVRPGKTACYECDSKCPECGGYFGYYSKEESPFERMWGWMCIACDEKHGFQKKT